MKYLLLKHYRGGPTPAVPFAPMDQWTPQEVSVDPPAQPGHGHDHH